MHLVYQGMATIFYKCTYNLISSCDKEKLLYDGDKISIAFKLPQPICHSKQRRLTCFAHSSHIWIIKSCSTNLQVLHHMQKSMFVCSWIFSKPLIFQLCQEGKEQSQFSTFILGSHDFEKKQCQFCTACCISPPMWVAVRPPRWRFLDIPNKRQMKQPKDRMSLTMQLKIIACSAIVDNSLFQPAATASSWQGWALYKLANPLYEQH